MANKHVKRCTVPYIIREFQLKQKWAYISISMAKLKKKKLTIPNADEDVEQQELLFIASRNVNNRVTLEDSLSLSYMI